VSACLGLEAERKVLASLTERSLSCTSLSVVVSAVSISMEKSMEK